MRAFDQVAHKYVELPPGWKTDDHDAVRDDRKARVIMTGPTGRYVAQRRSKDRWFSLRKPGGRRASYFRTLLAAIAHADRYVEAPE